LAYLLSAYVNIFNKKTSDRTIVVHPSIKSHPISEVYAEEEISPIKVIKSHI